MTAHYHPGKPGEISYAVSAARIRRLLANPFATGDLLYQIGAYTPSRNRRDRQAGRVLVPAGTMACYLDAAALRDQVQGEACDTCGRRPGRCECGPVYLYTITCCGRDIDIRRGCVHRCPACLTRFEARDTVPAMHDTITPEYHAMWRERPWITA